MARTKKIEAPSVPRTARQIDCRRFLADLRQVTGLALEMTESQGSLDIQYGYARIKLVGSGSYTHALGKREEAASELERRLDYNLEMDFGGEWVYVDLIQWAADILATGRTVACGQGINFHERSRRNPYAQTGTFPWYAVVEMIDGRDPFTDNHIEPLDLNPDYQRGSVWTRGQQERYVGFLLEGGFQGRIFIQRWDSNKNAPPERKKDYYRLGGEVVDGQQRLRAIYRWMKGEICAVSPETQEQLWYKDTNEVDRRGLMLELSFIDVSRAERIAFYIRLNTGGTAHTAEEIAKARALLAEEK